MKYWTALALILFVVGLTHAQDQNGPIGYGDISCKDWLKKSPAEELRSKSWLMGYLSGMNFAWTLSKQNPPNPLSKLPSVEHAYNWIDTYCKNESHKKVGDGAMFLFMATAKKALE